MSPKTLQDYIHEIETREQTREIQNLVDSIIASKLPQIEAELRRVVVDAIPALIPPPVAGKQGKKGTSGDKGEKPMLGKDYFVPTAEEIAKKVKVEAPPKLDEILSEIKKELPELVKQYAPQRHYSLIPRRSNAYFKVLTITGTKNGTNREFYLSEAPRFGADLFVFMNGLWLSSSDQFTVSGVTLTLDNSVPAPKSGWTFYAQAFRG